MNAPPALLWGADDPLAPLPGGHRNRVFKSGGKDPMVFKSCTRSEAAVHWLLPVLDLAEAAGFVVARPKRSRDGGYVGDGWTCEPFIAGTALRPEDLPDLLKPLERFHAAARPVPQRPGFLSSQALRVALQGGDVNLAGMPADLVAACRAAWAGLAGQEETIVHGDLCAGNVLRCPDGRFALIDWDEARRDVPAFDLVHLQSPGTALRHAHLAWETACSWRLEPDYARRKATALLASIPPPLAPE